MHIILIVLEAKENSEETLRHLGVFSVTEDIKLFAILARRKFQGAEIVLSRIQLQI